MTRAAFPADYYATASQIAVALFILIAVEYRWLINADEDDENPMAKRSWVGPAAIVGLSSTVALGVGSSLDALSDQRASERQDYLVVGCLVVESAALVAMPLLTLMGTAFRRHVATLDSQMAAVAARFPAPGHDESPAELNRRNGRARRSFALRVKLRGQLLSIGLRLSAYAILASLFAIPILALGWWLACDVF